MTKRIIQVVAVLMGVLGMLIVTQVVWALAISLIIGGAVVEDSAMEHAWVVAAVALGVVLFGVGLMYAAYVAVYRFSAAAVRRFCATLGLLIFIVLFNPLMPVVLRAGGGDHLLWWALGGLAAWVVIYLLGSRLLIRATGVAEQSLGPTRSDDAPPEYWNEA